MNFYKTSLAIYAGLSFLICPLAFAQGIKIDASKVFEIKSGDKKGYCSLTVSGTLGRLDASGQADGVAFDLNANNNYSAHTKTEVGNLIITDMSAACTTDSTQLDRASPSPFMLGDCKGLKVEPGQTLKLSARFLYYPDTDTRSFVEGIKCQIQ